MVMEGERLNADGEVMTHRISWWRVEEARQVRQLWERSGDGGVAWETVVEGVYARLP